jgi:hypothetical protein|nr:MAG TPA: hypothetical protein [Caudoviricetes sp.]
MDYIEFPYVLVTMGKPRTLFSMRDFEDVLRERIGGDAVQFFRQATEGAEAEINSLRETVRALELALETTEALL